MANKTEINNFLERKTIECVDKLKEERKEKLNEAIQIFMTRNGVEITKINSLINVFDVTLEKMVSNIEVSKTACINKHYRNPISLSNELHRCFTPYDISDQFTIVECEKVKTKYQKIMQESKTEYERLIAVTRTMDAKDGIVLLEKLGFDISEMQVKKVVTALMTNIDARKLFVS